MKIEDTRKIKDFPVSQKISKRFSLDFQDTKNLDFFVKLKNLKDGQKIEWSG